MKIEISRDAVNIVVKLLGANAKMNRQLIRRESLNVRELPGKKYLANAMISEAALINIESQTR